MGHCTWRDLGIAENASKVPAGGVSAKTSGKPVCRQCLDLAAYAEAFTRRLKPQPNSFKDVSLHFAAALQLGEFIGYYGKSRKVSASVNRSSLLGFIGSPFLSGLTDEDDLAGNLGPLAGVGPFCG